MRSRRGLRLTRLKYRRRADGSAVPYYRHPDGRFIRLPELPETHPAFLRAYAEAPLRDAPVARRPRRVAERSLEHLAREYEASAAFRALAEATRAQRHRIGRLILARGEGAAAAVPVAQIRRRHILADLTGLAPHPARNRIKVWRAWMGWALDHGWIADDPAASVKPPQPPRSDGFAPWTRAEIAAFRAHHPVGTEPRLAMELCLWTAAASADAVRLGRQMIDGDGWLRFARAKTGTPVEIPFTSLPAWMTGEMAEDHAALAAALAAAPPGRMLFLETRDGRPRSPKAFGAWLSSHARAAGLPAGRSPHGLRKARLISCAQAGWSMHQLMAWAGHLSPDEAVLYTRRAARRAVLSGTEQNQKAGTARGPRSKRGE